MKHRVKITLFDNGYAIFERLTMDDFKASVIASSNNGRIVKIEIVEWETLPEPARVADYFVPACHIVANSMADNFELFLGSINNWYFCTTYPIGQQPKGSVIIPNSEREATDERD